MDTCPFNKTDVFSPQVNPQLDDGTSADSTNSETFNFVDNNINFDNSNLYYRYIVSFKSYKSVNGHIESISSILKDFISNNIVTIENRNNPATREYPTDFIVINIKIKSEINQITEQLTQSNQIRYVWKDQIINNNSHKNNEINQNNENDHNNNNYNEYDYNINNIDQSFNNIKSFNEFYDETINYCHPNDTFSSTNTLNDNIETSEFTIQNDIHYDNRQSFSNRNLLSDEHNNARYNTGGKLFTRWSIEDESDTFDNNNNNINDNFDANINLNNFDINNGPKRQLLKHFLITEHLSANKLWDDGFTGKDVNVAVFDTGIDKKHSHFRNIDERTNWTDEDQLHDGIGHGTFVAGIIASHYSQCPGFAPDSIINTFRVFTNKQMSYTSWFLDAFNYAIYRRMNLLNLSIGGPDWLDMPFVDKVREMQANNVIMITACGNDGKYGTINNPADQLSVIGVGGITQDNRIASFQSRGMTTWELPNGYGRIKPDVVTVGQSLYGSAINGGCRSLSGTSVASPAVTGVAALLTSVIPLSKRWDIINPASLKQILVEGTDFINGLRLFEQGNGKINLINSYNIIKNYKKHISLIPNHINFNKCPDLWPFCRQELYYTSQPYIFNLTLLNPFSVIGKINNIPNYIMNNPTYEQYINIQFDYSNILWPWSGWLGLYIMVNEDGTMQNIKNISGKISVTVSVLNNKNQNKTEIEIENKNNKWNDHIVELPFQFDIIPKPNRHKRILWDQFRSLQYPHGYFPRDDIEVPKDMLDWNGDHLHSNYHQLYDRMKDNGYYIEILGRDYTCFDAKQYSTLVIVDPEEEFFGAEIRKIVDDVMNKGLSLLIFADWYNEAILQKSRFFDDNTRTLWDALTGGSNIPALNELLSKFHIQFSDEVVTGKFSIGSHSTYFATGNAIGKCPVGCKLYSASLNQPDQKKGTKNVPILGLFDLTIKTKNPSSGRIAIFGDSTCLDSNHKRYEDCFWLFDQLLQYTSTGEIPPELESNLQEVDGNFYQNMKYMFVQPKRRKRVQEQFNKISHVKSKGSKPQCLNSPWYQFALSSSIQSDLSSISIVSTNEKQSQSKLQSQSQKQQLNINKNQNGNGNGNQESKINGSPFKKSEPIININDININNQNQQNDFNNFISQQNDSSDFSMPFIILPFLSIFSFLIFLCVIIRPVRRIFGINKCIKLLNNQINLCKRKNKKRGHMNRESQYSKIV